MLDDINHYKTSLFFLKNLIEKLKTDEKKLEQEIVDLIEEFLSRTSLREIMTLFNYNFTIHTREFSLVSLDLSNSYRFSFPKGKKYTICFSKEAKELRHNYIEKTINWFTGRNTEVKNIKEIKEILLLGEQIIAKSAYPLIYKQKKNQYDTLRQNLENFYIN